MRSVITLIFILLLILSSALVAMSFEKKPARGRFAKKYNNNAQLQPEQHRRILAQQIKSEPGKRALERVSRAGERYEARRVKTEITDTRERRLIEAEREALRKRSPSPAPAPHSMQGVNSRALPLSAPELAALREKIKAAADVQDTAQRQRIHRERCELESKRLASVVDVEQRLERRTRSADRANRQTSRRPASPSAYRTSKRDRGLGD
jgi:hypothetical protein